MNEIYALNISTVFNHKTYLAYLPQAYRESVPYDTLLPMLPVLVTKFVRMEGDSVDLIFKANGRPLQLGGNASQFGTIKSDGVTLTTTAELVVLSLVKDLGITFDLSKLTRLGVEVICAEQSYHTERQITPALVDAYKQITYPVDPAQAVADLEPRFIQISADVEEIKNSLMTDTDTQEIIEELFPAVKLAEPLTFDILTDGVLSFCCSAANDQHLQQALEYSKDGGVTWTPITTSYSGTNIQVTAGESVQFRGDNDYFAYNISGQALRQCGFYGDKTTAHFNVRGNIMSIISKTGFENLTHQFKLVADASGECNPFRRFFYQNICIEDASELILPVADLSNVDAAYHSMFMGCTALKKGPDVLPAQIAGLNCYYGMFQDCTLLTAASEIKATVLAENCYGSMFRSCSGLVKAPELPVMTLAKNCYGSMFRGCTSLVEAPDLPALATAVQSYYNMFYGCVALNYVKCLLTTITQSNDTNYWLYQVAATGKFVKATSMESWPTGESGIPTGWTVENA